MCVGCFLDDAYVTASDGACEDNDTDCPLSVEGREQLSDLDCKENVNVELNTRQLKNKHEGPSPMLHGVHHTRQTQKTEDDYLSTTDTEASSAFNDNEIQKTQARKIAIELTKPSENLVCEVDTTRIVSLNRPSKLGDEENSMILMERWSNNDRQFSNAGTGIVFNSDIYTCFQVIIDCGDDIMFSNLYIVIPKSDSCHCHTLSVSPFPSIINLHWHIQWRTWQSQGLAHSHAKCSFAK